MTEKDDAQCLYYCTLCGRRAYIFMHDTVPLCCGAFMRAVSIEQKVNPCEG